VPGIKVLAPGTVQDAHDMLLAGLAEPDPVVIFEHQVLYATEGELEDVPDPQGSVWRSLTRRPGRDLTLVTFGGMLPKALQAAEQLAAEQIEVEVIDLRCLRPLDLAPVVQSVKRTRRLLVSDEGWTTGGLAGEVIAQVTAAAFYELDAPPARACSVEVPVPYAAHMERAALPQVASIVAAAKRVVGHG
jgi:pyruvate dehydrogenase E1 component beta subunit